MGGNPQKDGRRWPLETTCKDFNLAIGEGLGWRKWLKNGAGKGIMFHAIIPALYPFWWVRAPSYSVRL